MFLASKHCKNRSTMVVSFSCLSSTKLIWILELLLILVTMLQVHGQSHSGFINIDCGWKNSSGYPDKGLGIPYSNDEEFVNGGLSHQILPEFMDGVGNDQQKTLRSFPDGPRNCYTLPSTVGKKYLLRAFFTYGNYDRLNRTMDGSLFLFGLHIGVNLWQAVNFTNWDPSRTIWKELLTVAPGSSLSLCLINFGSGTPFVSALELRPLEDAMYPFVNTSVSVSYIQRYTFGNAPHFITRYPTDSYDRFWQSWAWTSVGYSYWLSLNTSRTVNRQQSIDAFQVPQAILQKASTLYTGLGLMAFNVPASPNLDVSSLELIPVFHFAEIATDRPNRTFNVFTFGELLFQNVSPSPMQVDSMYPTNRFLTDRFLSGIYRDFTLSRAPTSALPPLINAFEMYSLVRMENFTTSSNDVDNMKEVKKHYNLERINWNGDPCSPREYTWDGLTCDYSNGNQNPRIVRINMSTSGLQGGLAISLLNMSSLDNLDLSHNNLTGTIPNQELKLLRVLNLSNNQLNGPIPDPILQRVQAGLLELRLEGNPLCSKVKDVYCSNKNTTHVLLIAVIVPVILVPLLVLMCTLWKICWIGKSGDDEDYAVYEEETLLDIDIRRFTYIELKLITKGFQLIIGKGGFGIVYHGILENGDEVAVKVLMETSIAKSTDFLPEVQTLSKVHHKNLVTLKGFCQNKKCLALIYDFMPKGNLQQLLRGGNGYNLNWEQRLHIALGAAQGLEYLHESCTPSIVHRDVKTPNILLDKNLMGIISDFGLSRTFNDVHTHISTVAAGTVGYLDPECHATFKVTIKTDVYSFGIVLLEIITGQPPVLMDPQAIHLPNWVRETIANGSVHSIVDKRLLDQYDVSSLQSVVDLAMNCIENTAINKPTMTEVVSRLKVWPASGSKTLNDLWSSNNRQRGEHPDGLQRDVRNKPLIWTVKGKCAYCVPVTSAWTKFRSLLSSITIDCLRTAI